MAAIFGGLAGPEATKAVCWILPPQLIMPMHTAGGARAACVDSAGGAEPDGSHLGRCGRPGGDEG